ncbi:MAG: TolC family protein [Chitinophagaceae bacterium]|nr:TolC family protein [Chitinophagaceae bacterium]
MSRKRFFITRVLTGIILMNTAVMYVSAQDKTKGLSLEEAISATIDHNKTLQLANLDVTIATANFKQTEAIYLPQIGLSYTGMSTNNPLNAFGFKMQQKSITQNDFNPELLNHPAGTPDFTTKLELMQPLINMDMLYMRKGAEKQVEVYQYKKQRTKEYIIFEVQKAFLQLQLAHKATLVLEEALLTSKAVFQFTENHFKQGLIQKSDLLNVQVQIASVENNLAKAKSNIQNVSDYLGLLMGVPGGSIYTIKSTTETGNQRFDLLQEIPSNRADFEAMKKAIEASDLMIKSSKMSDLPKLNAFGSYQLNDSRMLGFGAGAYLAGVSISWNIFKGNLTKNKMATQTLERNKLSVQLEQQKEQSNTDLNKTRREIADIQVEILQHTKTIEQASEALRILQNRYEQGLVNTTDVMQSATQLSQQKLALAQAMFTQQVTNAYLQFLTTSNIK